MAKARPVALVEHPSGGVDSGIYVHWRHPRQTAPEDLVGVGTGLDEGIKSLRQALLAASTAAGLEVHVRPVDPPRVPDALDLWDQAGEHKNCPEQLEVILRLDRIA